MSATLWTSDDPLAVLRHIVDRLASDGRRPMGAEDWQRVLRTDGYRAGAGGVWSRTDANEVYREILPYHEKLPHRSGLGAWQRAQLRAIAETDAIIRQFREELEDDRRVVFPRDARWFTGNLDALETRARYWHRRGRRAKQRLTLLVPSGERDVGIYSVDQRSREGQLVPIAEKWARRLGCDAAQSVALVACDLHPLVPPVSVRVRRVDEVANRIDLTVNFLWVSEEVVRFAWRLGQDAHRKEFGNLHSSELTGVGALFDFVDERRESNAGWSWPGLFEEWNRDNPEAAYKTRQSMRVSYRNAKKRRGGV